MREKEEGQTEKYVAPTNKTEKVIVEAFNIVFNQKNIGLFEQSHGSGRKL